MIRYARGNTTEDWLGHAYNFINGELEKRGRLKGMRQGWVTWDEVVMAAEDFRSDTSGGHHRDIVKQLLRICNAHL